jgi:hypothetical protein
MSESSPDSVFIKFIWPLSGAAIGWLIGLLPGGLTDTLGSALISLLAAAGGVCGLICSLIYKRYLGILGASTKRKGTSDREGYDRLRASLSFGNPASRLYAESLTKFLGVVDRFFGDSGRADRTLLPRAFGLKKPAPLWTAPAFDRCLLLAMIYPVVTILVIWAISGHVGPAEATLHLKRDLPSWHRGIIVTYCSILSFGIWLAWPLKNWH